MFFPTRCEEGICEGIIESRPFRRRRLPRLGRDIETLDLLLIVRRRGFSLSEEDPGDEKGLGLRADGSSSWASGIGAIVDWRLFAPR